jgi:hypothetical protein
MRQGEGAIRHQAVQDSGKKMPFEIFWEPKGAYKKVHGVVTAQEFMRSITELQSDPRFDRLKYTINDFTGAQALRITESDIHHYAAMGIGAANSNPGIRIAIVADNPEIVAMVRVYASLSPYQTEFFGDMASARAWIEGRVAPSPA